MYQNTKITKGLSENDTNLRLSIELFLRDRKAQNVSAGTIHFYSVKLKSFSAYCDSQGITEITDITPDLIRKFLSSLQESNHTDGGVHAFYRTIRTFLYFWEEEFEPDNYKNPIRKVKAPRVAIEPIEGIGISNFNKLLESCPKKTNNGERDRTILLVLLETGIRATELCDLNYEDIDLIDSSILVRKGKGRKPRYVFIGRTTRKQIRSYLKFRGEDKGALFNTQTGERISYWTLREIVRRLSVKANIPEPGLHDFRRTFALESLKKGIDIQSLSRLMGHSDLQILSRYLKQTPKDLFNAYKSIID